ncbi:hypothetical protein QQF64_018867 [Cirrhinus molitorella]|uniref:Uncharacterized protein n=1 Tax=Cirrhinus molitorella TaxID=172907 RepID=A0ABR3LG81_9TELE
MCELYDLERLLTSGEKLDKSAPLAGVHGGVAQNLLLSPAVFSWLSSRPSSPFTASNSPRPPILLPQPLS